MAGESPDSRAPKALKKRKRARSESPEPAANESGITELESQILDSQRHYNKIATLHRFAFQNGSKNELRHQSIIALCRIFTKLMITGNMTKVSGATTNEELIVNWLNEQYGKYRDCLLDMVRRPHRDDSWVALQLLMQLLREESHSISRSEDGLWTKGLFTRILRAIVESSSSRELCADFIETYMIAYTDIRLYTFRGLRYDTLALLKKVSKV